MNQTLPSVKPPSFPLRPVSGGPLDKAPPKGNGRWHYEPKLNGWRAWVHCPTGLMFNRRNEPLSIPHEFQAVRDRLKLSPIEWLDVEALSRRVDVGKGSLVILDAPIAGTYEERQQAIYDQLIGPGIGEAWGQEQFPPPPNTLLSFSYTYEDCEAEETKPLTAWQRLQDINKALRCELFEGLVAKRADSTYPLQLRSPDIDFPFWMKHGWAF